MSIISSHKGLNINDGVFASLTDDIMKFGVIPYSVSSLQEFCFLSQVSKTFYMYVKEIKSEISCFFDNHLFCTEYKDQMRRFVSEKLGSCDFIKKNTREGLLLKINSEEGTGKEIIGRLNEVEKSLVTHREASEAATPIAIGLSVFGFVALAFFCLMISMVDALFRALF